MHGSTWCKNWRVWRRPRVFALMIPCTLVAVACASHDAMEQDANAPALPDSVFEYVRTVALEENDEVVNVSPDVSVQEDGSFLIADGREARIRTYDPEGGLVTQFGRRGEAPASLDCPWRRCAAPTVRW